MEEVQNIIPFRQNLFGSIRTFPEPIQFFVLGASLSYGKPPKRGETLAKELNLERSDFVFDRQPDAFRLGRAHQWLRAGRIFQPITKNEKPLTLRFSSLVWDEILTLYVQQGLNEGNNR